MGLDLVGNKDCGGYRLNGEDGVFGYCSPNGGREIRDVVVAVVTWLSQLLNITKSLGIYLC